VSDKIFMKMGEKKEREKKSQVRIMLIKQSKEENSG